MLVFLVILKGGYGKIRVVQFDDLGKSGFSMDRVISSLGVLKAMRCYVVDNHTFLFSLIFNKYIR